MVSACEIGLRGVLGFCRHPPSSKHCAFFSRRKASPWGSVRTRQFVGECVEDTNLVQAPSNFQQ
eukprot:11309263-Alexandrium_andersonii.AAC.1